MQSVFQTLFEWLHGFGELIFAAAIVIACLFFGINFVAVPRTLLSLPTGATFGPDALGVIVPSTSLGSVAAFLCARYLFHRPIRVRLERRPLLGRLMHALDSESWTLALLLRLMPIPVSVGNYVFALTKIHLLPFAALTLLVTLPNTVVYVQVGAIGRGIMADGPLESIEPITSIVAVVSLGLSMVRVYRRMRSPLQTRVVSTSCSASPWWWRK